MKKNKTAFPKWEHGPMETVVLRIVSRSDIVRCRHPRAVHGTTSNPVPDGKPEGHRSHRLKKIRLARGLLPRPARNVFGPPYKGTGVCHSLKGTARIRSRSGRKRKEILGWTGTWTGNEKVDISGSDQSSRCPRPRTSVHKGKQTGNDHPGRHALDLPSRGQTL